MLAEHLKFNMFFYLIFKKCQTQYCSGRDVCLLGCVWLCDSMVCSLPGSSAPAYSLDLVRFKRLLQHLQAKFYY